MRFKIEAGNSNEGPVGFVISLEADSKDAALKKAKEVVSDYTASTIEVECSDIMGTRKAEYFNVYLNADALTLENVYEDDD